jgi:hypothetical protein
VVVGGRCSVQRSSDFWNVDMDDLLSIRVVNSATRLANIPAARIVRTHGQKSSGYVY